MDDLAMPMFCHQKLPSNEICAVCLEQAFGRHFGVPSCNACAAFFRRTVACKKIYQCHYGHCCKLIHIKTRTMCKYCRYKRCLDVGMQVSEVQSDYKGHHIGRGEKSSNENTPSPPLMTNFQLLDSSTIYYAVIYESIRHFGFLNNSQLREFLSGKNYLMTFDGILSAWMNIEKCHLKEIYNGDQLETVFCITDEFLKILLTFLQNFCQIDLKNADQNVTAKIVILTNNWILQLAKLLKLENFDEYKFVILIQLTFIQIAIETSKNMSQTKIELAPYVCALTEDVKKHDTVKIDDMVFFLNKLQIFKQDYNQQITQLFS